MSTRGSLPPASIHGTWIESAEIWDTDTDTYMDLTGVIEITLTLIRAWNANIGSIGSLADMTLTMGNGDIVIPAPGVIQWRAERDAMGTLIPGLYEMVLTFDGDTDTIVIAAGTVSILG